MGFRKDDILYCTIDEVTKSKYKILKWCIINDKKAVLMQQIENNGMRKIGKCDLAYVSEKVLNELFVKVGK